MHHDLKVYQDDIRCATLEDPRATISVLTKIEGKIEPAGFFGQGGLTLGMEDHETVSFFFTDSHGSVCVSGAPTK